MNQGRQTTDIALRARDSGRRLSVAVGPRCTAGCPHCGPSPSSPRRGFSLIEALGAALLLALVLTATGRLLGGAQRQQRQGGAYSQAQTSLRQGLRRALRTARHGWAVIGTSAQGNLNGLSSNSTQAIVNIPDAGGATIQMRIYVNGGNLYAQRSDQAAPGTMLNDPMPAVPFGQGVSQVQSVTFRYYQTFAGVRTNVDATPATATEVEMVLAAQVGPVTTTASGAVTMRNNVVGL